MRFIFIKLSFLVFAFSCAHNTRPKLSYSSSMYETARIGNGTPNHVIERSQVSKKLVLIGPAEGFNGEVTIVDGKIYQSSIDKQKVVTLAPSEIKTVFNVRVECNEWKELSPFAVGDINELENRLKSYDVFFLNFQAKIDRATIHIVNGVDPKKMRPTKKAFQTTNESYQLVGVYSQRHQRVFTHHDRVTHLHVIDQLGHTYHLDEATGIKIMGGKICYVAE